MTVPLKVHTRYGYASVKSADVRTNAVAAAATRVARKHFPAMGDLLRGGRDNKDQGAARVVSLDMRA